MIELTNEDRAAIRKYNISDEQLEWWEQEAREKVGDQLKGEKKEQTILKIIRNRISETIEKKQYKEKSRERNELKLSLGEHGWLWIADKDEKKVTVWITRDEEGKELIYPPTEQPNFFYEKEAIRKKVFKHIGKSKDIEEVVSKVIIKLNSYFVSKQEEQEKKQKDRNILSNFLNEDSTIRLHPAIDIFNKNIYIGTYKPDIGTLLISENRRFAFNTEGFIIKEASYNVDSLIEGSNTGNLTGEDYNKEKKTEKDSYNVGLRNDISYTGDIGIEPYIFKLLLSEQCNEGKIKKEGILEKLQNELIMYLRKYVFKKNRVSYIITACWIIGTYLFPIFQAYPVYLIRGSKGTGKTTLATLIQKLSFCAPNIPVNFSEPWLKRKIHRTRGTIVFDEAQHLRFSEKYPIIIAVIEGGTEKGKTSAITEQQNGDNTYGDKEFDIYSPKCIATRESITFEDKAISDTMERPPKDQIKYFSRQRAKLEITDFTDIKTKLVRFALTYSEEIYDTYMNLEPDDDITGRAFQYWSPILSIAKVVFPEDYEEIKKTAAWLIEKENATIKEREEENIVILAISKLVDGEEQKTKTLKQKDITDKVNELDEERTYHYKTIEKAIRNTNIALRRMSNPTRYEIDIERVNALIEERGIKEEEAEELNPEEDEEDEPEIELIDEPENPEGHNDDEDIDDAIQNNRKKGSCEVCGKVTNLVPVVQNHKTVMVCRVCREKVKQEQLNETQKPWNIGGVNLI